MRASWELLHACNYRCPYCPFIPSWENDAQRTNNRHKALTAADWIAFWDRVHRRHGEAAIEVSGGEPTTYPGFWALADRVAQHHKLTILTNLSFDPINGLLLDPKRVSFLASYHPDFADLEPFRAKCADLRSRGFEVRVTVVAHPDVFDRLEALERAFVGRADRFIPAPLQGEHAGKRFPEGYSEAQKARLRRWRGERDALFELGLAEDSPRGRLCGAGTSYFRAYPDGEIWRCVSLKDSEGARPLGSIRDAELRLSEAAQPCPAARCLCRAEYVELDRAEKSV
jgi:MoaA/NifB/PqqE/SkfB family radical SAM enzyme